MLLLLQAHQEKLCRGNQVPRASLGILVLQVSLVPEGSLGSLGSPGAVISLDVMRLIEEVSPDYVSAKWWFYGWSLVTSLEPAETSDGPSGTISPAKPPLQSSQGDSCATHVDKSQLHGLLLHALTHNAALAKQVGRDHEGPVLVTSNISMGDGERDNSSVPAFAFHGGSLGQRPGWWRNSLARNKRFTRERN